MTNKENYPKIALGTWSWGTGAAGGDSWFAHLAIEVPGEKTSNEWLEPVTDEEYNKLQTLVQFWPCIRPRRSSSEQ